jgi:DNA-binding MarR family transcriptional regulator
MDETREQLTGMDELSVSVQLLFRAVEMQRRRLAHEQGATITEVRALARIAELPGISNAQLAADLDLKPSTISSLVDSLVERHLAVRSVDPDNRRRLHLVLTDQGREIAQGVYLGFAAAVREAAGRLESDGRLDLASSLRQLSVGLTPPAS